MIRAEYDDRELVLFIYGHAGYAERGKDIVCAGVSTLVYTLCAATDSALVDGVVELKHSYRNRIVFNTVIKGLKMISQRYPDNVRIFRIRYPTEEKT